LFDRDKDGLALRNAANNSFEQPFSKDKTVLFLNATRNFADFDPTLSTKYGNTINSKDFKPLRAIQDPEADLQVPCRAAPGRV
jgi:hypothetical protein